MGLAGWSGAGKTTLLVRVLPLLVARGMRVSTIKHAHHDFDIDKPGKDSWRHRQAGAQEVLVASDRRWALMHELLEEPALDLPALLARLGDADLVLIEGFKHAAHAKIEVHRAANGKPFLFPGDRSFLAIAADQRIADAPLPVLDLNDAEAIAAFIAAEAVPLEQVSLG